MKLVPIVNLIIYSCLPQNEFYFFLFQLQPFFFKLFTTFGVLKVYKYISRLIIWIVSIISIIRFILDDYYHESGSIEVVKYLHNLDSIESLGFVMPCHSTPGQSYLHRNDISDLWSISCEPPLTLLDSKDISNKLSQYMDESDYFYDDIPNFVNKYFSDGKDNIDSIEFNQLMVLKSLVSLRFQNIERSHCLQKDRYTLKQVRFPYI